MGRYRASRRQDGLSRVRLRAPEAIAVIEVPFT
jgi:hypothetical protein